MLKSDTLKNGTSRVGLYGYISFKASVQSTIVNTHLRNDEKIDFVTNPCAHLILKILANRDLEPML